jgi:predicted enzyme related to lactoylglutathione lyase
MAHVIDYVEFAVDDLDEAKAFYSKALGWHSTTTAPTTPGSRTPHGPARSSAA